MDKQDKILITGANGVLGKALEKLLIQSGFTHLELATSQKCNLLNLEETIHYFKKVKPTYVFHLAGYVKGIMGNMQNKGLSYFNNICINTHTAEAARMIGVKKIIAMGTVAAYPNFCETLPYHEDMIWNGYPHSSEDSYAQAKRAMLAQLIAYKESYGLDYAYVISTNLYGPHDRFDKDFGHVIPSLVVKFHEAKLTASKVNVWGNGLAERDFVYSEDAANALMQIAQSFSGVINLASGETHTIKKVVHLLSQSAGIATDQIEWDASKPNGQLLRCYDTTKLKTLNVQMQYSLEKGLGSTYEWYANNAGTARK